MEIHIETALVNTGEFDTVVNCWLNSGWHILSSPEFLLIDGKVTGVIALCDQPAATVYAGITDTNHDERQRRTELLDDLINDLGARLTLTVGWPPEVQAYSETDPPRRHADAGGGQEE